jgi:serine phosphatase RsbU (regulator of sigma subunit)/anti-sigma regulatory factor (Ser/Thr protein kinase)
VRGRQREAEPQVRGALDRALRWFTPRREMVAIGLVGTVLPLVLLATALDALQEVTAAHGDVADIAEAQADFQRADMAHDAMRADLLALFLGEGAPEEVSQSLKGNVDVFLTNLQQARNADLPPKILRQLAQVQPLQQRYANDVRDVGNLALTDSERARARLPDVTERFEELTVEQERITEAMQVEADARIISANEAETAVRRSMGASAAVALFGMAGLTLLLNRLGGSLAASLARERGVAETLQHSLLPDRLPDVPGVRLAARYVPGAVGSQVGGDWYDVVPLPSGEIGLVMGDVVGHDLGAAASMGQLRNALRACAAEGAPPDEVLERLNRLCLQQDLGGMATVLYAVLDPVQGTLRMASAGHYPPLLLTGEESRFIESEPRPPIGAVREVQYDSSLHQLPAGTVLVLYTDGLVERRGLPVEAGMAELADLGAASAGAASLDDVADAVLTGMFAGEPPQDDVAVLVVAPQAVLGTHLELVLPAEAERLAVVRRTLERWLAEAGATEEEIYEITVACSEATTNAIEHAYGPGRADLQLLCDVDDGVVTLVVRDWGQWREPRGRDRGRGTSFMHGLMDEVEVLHGDRGTQVVMRRRLEAAKAAKAAKAATAGTQAAPSVEGVSA